MSRVVRKPQGHGVWKSQKKSHSTLWAKRATFFILSGQKLFKMPKKIHLASFWKPEACGQTMLPDMSVLIGQKLVENAKIQKFNVWFSEKIVDFFWGGEKLVKMLWFWTF